MMTNKGEDSGILLGPARLRVNKTMRLIEIAIGIILLGGAAWTTVRTCKGVDFSPRVRRIPRRPGLRVFTRAISLSLLRVC